MLSCFVCTLFVAFPSNKPKPVHVAFVDWLWAIEEAGCRPATSGASFNMLLSMT